MASSLSGDDQAWIAGLQDRVATLEKIVNQLLGSGVATEVSAPVVEPVVEPVVDPEQEVLASELSILQRSYDATFLGKLAELITKHLSS